MKKFLLPLIAMLPFVLVSCATNRQPVAFHNTDNSALVIKSLDVRSCQVVAPTTISQEENSLLLEQAKNFAQHQTVVVILENYFEPQLGREFRDRTLGWFIGLRGLGYQHIVFVRGSGVANPDGLPLLAEYD
jgi:hypothetical protein